MNKAYTRIDWENEPSTNTPINETNLNKMDYALDELDNRVIAQDTSKADKTEVSTLIANVEFDESTGIITVTRKNGSSFTIDTKLEKIAINFTYDKDTQQFILTLVDGTKQYIDLSALITQYEFLDSDTITFVVQSNGSIKAEVLDGSITENKLQPNYLAQIKVETAKSESYMNNASQSAKSSSDSANMSKSYAVGGTGTREGEDTDNAKYYYQQAKSTDVGKLRQDVDEINRNLENQTLFSTYPFIKGYYRTYDGVLTLVNDSQWKIYTVKTTTGSSYTISGIENHGGYIPQFVGEKADGTKEAITYPHNYTFENNDYVKMHFSIYVNDTNASITRKDVGTMCFELRDEVTAQNASLSDYGLVNVFDGELEQGFYDTSDGTKHDHTICVRTANKINVNNNDVVTVKYNGELHRTDNAETITVLLFNNDTFVSSLRSGISDNSFTVTIPSNVNKIHLNISTSSGINVESASGKVSVYVNNAIEENSIFYKDIAFTGIMKLDTVINTNEYEVLSVRSLSNDITILCATGWTVSPSLTAYRVADAKLVQYNDSEVTARVMLVKRSRMIAI